MTHADACEFCGGSELIVLGEDDIGIHVRCKACRDRFTIYRD